MRRRVIIAVVGAGQRQASTGSATYSLAQVVGELNARRGGILLCGGGSGVMEAAALGADAVAGRTIEIMKEGEGGPKASLGLVVWTGLGDGRNYVNAIAADAMIALQGEAGTLSEIALALKIGRPVMALRAWEFLAQAGFRIQCHHDPEEAVSEAFRAARADEAGFVEAGITYPRIPDQSAQSHAFKTAVETWSK